MNNIIFHIDFDSYFASAHRVLNPQYENKPIAIADNKKRSIACSVSYELKNKGAKSGWPNYKILQVEPRTIFIKPDFNLYVKLSTKIFEYLAQNYTKKIEVYSIDECWMDVSDITNLNDAEQLALKIQQQIKQKFRIPISIGISFNKFIAKLSTNLAKPFGVLLTKFSDIKNRIWPLDIEEYFGIGKSTATKLRNVGINTIGKLAARNKYDHDLYEIFKSQTSVFIEEAKGNGKIGLNYARNELKSIGNELTFLSIDLDDRTELLKILYQLSLKVSTRAINRNMLGYSVTVSLRSIEKVWRRKQLTLKHPINAADEIYKNGTNLFNQLFKEQMIRGIGIKLSQLVNEFDIGKPQSLFEDQKTPDTNKLKILVDDLNKKIRKKVLKTGIEFEKDKVKENVQNRYLKNDREEN
ncbi:DNA polymerase IV [Mycoplasmopsis phocirhinis]|uniref:DNA polymerase IV n=1 Tax=Mycoplasmopsis phocirhinis TaxID=142650 RepID=A0A4P6MTC9_9BACT|nr:DNA polymerase IV [Mycoplasmopsis phocirhinis]QBF34587.1 DNA polymerase IV [Mycoplasmopsis phocirhinis]